MCRSIEGSPVNLDEMKAALLKAAAAPPTITRFEVSPQLDHQLHNTVLSAPAVSYAATTVPHGLIGVPWTVDPQLEPLQIRTHWSDGRTEVHDI